MAEIIPFIAFCTLVFGAVVICSGLAYNSIKETLRDRAACKSVNVNHEF